MFTGVYRVIRVFSAISAVISFQYCKYYRVFLTDIAEKPLNHPVNPCKHLQCETVFILSDLKIFFQRSYLTHYFLIKDNIMSLKKPESQFGPVLIAVRISVLLRTCGRSKNLEGSLKFLFFKKATKIDEIFTVYLTLTTSCQIDGEDFVNFCGLRKHKLY